MAVKIIVCLDGCAPEYIERSDTPNLDALGREGFKTIGSAVVPTVTNVNNTTIVTANYPEVHGITANYYRDAASGREVYMESSEFLLAETMFRNVSRHGGKAAVLTAKDKLKALIGDGADVAESAEKAPAWLVDRLGPPPPVYSIEINHWLFRAAAEVLRRESPDLLYVTTTDYVTHMHGPEDERAQWNMNRLDGLLGELMNAAPEVEIVVTADHGMNPKSRALDLDRILHAAGIRGWAVPIIKDRYVVHHRNMGGAAYVYLEDAGAMAEAFAVLHGLFGVESVMAGPEAARIFHLHPGRVGDLFVLADVQTVFGTLSAEEEEVKIRSHGSVHEHEIPIYAFGPGPVSVRPRSNREVSSWIFRP